MFTGSDQRKTWTMSGVRSTSPQYKGHAVGPDGDPVVIVPYWDKAHGECLANARLISAAPDGYQLAREVRQLLSENNFDADYAMTILRFAEDIIKKVEGYSNG